MQIRAPHYTPIDLTAPGSRPGPTLVVTDRADVASAAAAVGVECWSGAPDDADGARLGAHLRAHGGRYDTLLVAWGDGPAAGAPTYQVALRHAVGGLALLQAVREAGRPGHLVTLSDQADLLGSLLDGMATSAAQEFPLSHTAVEADGPVTGERLDRWLAAVARHPGTRLRVTGDRAARREYVPRSLAHVPPAEVFARDDHVVLIGGAGGVGRELCRYLSERCGARVVVVGRRSPDHATLAALREAGARSYVAAPADEPEALTDLFRHLHDGSGPVRAVVNLAGVLDDCLLRNLTPDRLAGVLRPKVAVGLNLARLSGPYRPELVVNFSSLTSVTGNVGQVAYGAANAFLDRLTSRLPHWYSVNWGLWDTDGMRMPDDGSSLRAMHPRAACDVLLSVIAAGTRQLVVFAGQVRLPGDGPSAGSGWTRGDDAPEPPGGPTPGSAAPTDLPDRTRRWLHALVARHTGLKHLGDRDNLLDHGLDSVGSVRITRDIETRLAIGGSARLSRAAIFEHPTVAALAAHLVEKLSPQLAAYFAGPPANRADPPPETAPTPVPDAAGPSAAVAGTVGDAATVGPDCYRPDDIAIIGMAGEFPGGADVEAFWLSLRAGGDAVRVVPGDRWEWRDTFPPSPDGPDVSGRHGGFLDHALDFDPVFFTITPVEAEAMDPQARRFLQAAYHALEDSGHFARPTSDVGVFVAAMYGHYQDLDAPDRVVDSSFAAIANRVSYALDLHGPSVALDTMCSGGLTALHLAAASIRAGDCALALAGGVNIMTHPGKYRLLSEGRFLSPTGYCHAFGVAADGYVPGEGSAAVVLKSLAAALRDGDRIHAVIRATAVNSGGRTAGFTVPSVRAQQRVITSALSRAGLGPEAITYVEAHGTGTQLGDPIEVEALRQSYGGPEYGPAHLGTVKSNIGHLESAAAMAGLVKVVTQLTHRTLVPTLHCELENPHLNLDDSRFSLVRETRPWPAGPGPTRFAGLSSFGAGGSCGHAIIQEYVASGGPRAVPEFPRYFIPLSGRNEVALRRRGDDLLAALRATPDLSPYGLSYTLCCARQHFRVRCGWWVGGVAELIDVLATGTEPTPGPVNDDTWGHAATEYLDGRDPDFPALFPVRELVDVPLYPFAAERYVAGSLEPARRAAGWATAHRDSLLLTPVWRRHPADPPGERPVRCVLALTDPGRASALPAPPDGITLVRVVPGDTLTIGTERIVLPDGDDAAADSVLAHLTRDRGLDHLHWVGLRLEWPVEAVLPLARAMQSCRTPSTILTVGDLDDGIEARAVAGFFHGLAEENPHVRAVLARRSGPAVDWRPLLAELRAARRPVTEVSWTDGTRWRRELDEVRLGAGTRLRHGGRYLISGGLGTVGRAVAELLVDRYRARVVVVSRSAPDAAARSWLATRDGVHHERADITSAEQTHEIVARVGETLGGLDGVIHSAGVVADALVQNKSVAQAASVLAPKVRGTRNLDRSTADLTLDFFCVFSSISSLLGNVGQSDYIAANRFLDEFAAERAGQVTRGERTGFTLSINWPLWWAADDGRRDRYRALAGYLRTQFGLEPLTSRRGARLFLDLLDGLPGDCHQVLACVGDVPRLRERLVPAATGEPITPAHAAEPAASAAPGPAPLPAQCDPMASPGDAASAGSPGGGASPGPDSGRRVEIGGRLVELVRAQTGLPPVDIAVDQTWGDLGYSSVMLQQLAQRLDAEFGVPVPPNALFAYRSIRSLSGYLQEHGATARTPCGVAATDAPAREPRDAAPTNGPGRVATGPADTDTGFDGYAVVGMSGTMPGGRDLAGYWRLLIENRSAIRPVERWAGRGRYLAGTIDTYASFDHTFFGLSAREAMLMDPQHRLFLQSAYNALLDAGYAPGALTDVGVFAGVQFSEYQAALRGAAERAHPYAVTGNSHTMLANRVSHLLDFTGPSQTVDTACSSGLVALNRGVLALATRECQVAVVGAVSVLVDPAATDAASGLGVLSPDFRCATFDRDANGYVRAEGVGCVVVKRLADARRDGDSVYAVIRSVAENHDGRANSLTAPNPQAQVALLEKAYPPELAALVTAIETHGTGTGLGDPIEVGALRTAFRRLAPHRAPGSIALGAVKTNVGHLEPAAGMAGLLKMLLCLERRVLPANLHFRELNPLIELTGSPLRLLLENENWKDTGPLVAGVSSFGFGGSNAHVVLAEAPAGPPARPTPRPYWLVTLSARSARSLAAMRDDLLRWLRGADSDLADIAYTLGAGRDHFEYRLAWIASGVADLRDQVEAARPAEVARCERNLLAAPPLAPPDDPGNRVALAALRERYLAGGEPDWTALFGGGQFCRLHLPGYAFDPTSFWFE